MRLENSEPTQYQQSEIEISSIREVRWQVAVAVVFLLIIYYIGVLFYVPRTKKYLSIYFTCCDSHYEKW